jgi:hypothetical protein
VRVSGLPVAVVVPKERDAIRRFAHDLRPSKTFRNLGRQILRSRAHGFSDEDVSVRKNAQTRRTAT